MDISFIHKITSPEEQRQFYDMDRTCFLSSSDEYAFEPKTAQQMEEAGYELWGCGSPISSGMVVNDYDVWFDGALQKAAGIGGVCTLPEARNRGGMRRIFEKLLPYWYQKGYTFSTLYPFSHRFYRKFGYEIIQKANQWYIPMSALKDFPHTARARLVTDYKELQPVAYEFGRRQNLTINRKGSQWGMLPKDPVKDVTYCYLIDDDAYVIFTKGGHDPLTDEYKMKVKDFAYESEDAFRRMMGFLYQLNAQFGSVEITLPSQVPIFDMVPEPYDVRLNVDQNGMARLVNIQKALRVMRYPSGTGRFTLRAVDAQIPENNDIFSVTYKDGRCTNLMRLSESDLAKQSSMSREEAEKEAQKQAQQAEQQARLEKEARDFTSSAVGFQEEHKTVSASEPSIDIPAPQGFLTDLAQSSDLRGFQLSSGSRSEDQNGEAASSDQAPNGTESQVPLQETASCEETPSKNPAVQPDLTCSIQTLTRLMCGSLSLAQAAYLPDLICRDPKKLEGVFPGKDIFFNDPF